MITGRLTAISVPVDLLFSLVTSMGEPGQAPEQIQEHPLAPLP
jgi:hypothetical protein